jgi:hypothetical protein
LAGEKVSIRLVSLGERDEMGVCLLLSLVVG